MSLVISGLTCCAVINDLKLFAVITHKLLPMPGMIDFIAMEIVKHILYIIVLF